MPYSAWSKKNQPEGEHSQAPQAQDVPIHEDSSSSSSRQETKPKQKPNKTKRPPKNKLRFQASAATVSHEILGRPGYWPGFSSLFWSKTAPQFRAFFQFFIAETSQDLSGPASSCFETCIQVFFRNSRFTPIYIAVKLRSLP